MEIAKWKILDSSCLNNVRQVRFNELTKMILEGDLQGFDLICPPHDTRFVPIKNNQAVYYYYLKQKQNQKMLFRREEERCYINSRLFPDYRSGARCSHVDKKLILFEKFSQKIYQVLDKDETVVYSVLAHLRYKKRTARHPLEPKGISLVIFTDKRVIELSFSEKMRHLEAIRLIPYFYISYFDIRPHFFNRRLFILVTSEGEVIQMKDLKNFELEKIQDFLDAYMESARKSPLPGATETVQTVCPLCLRKIYTEDKFCPCCSSIGTVPVDLVYDISLHPTMT
jgi:hypothetical protein